ncbi:MAG: site-2 protease family protein [Planctomycetota bacterium]
MLPDHPALIVAFFLVLLLALSWHEAAHAWVADRLGDPTARELGRVTLNPLKHLDPFLSVILPGLLILIGSPFLFGGGKPVPINVNNFERRARDFMLVALAGPGSNLLLAAAFGVAWVISAHAGILPPIVIQQSPDLMLNPSIFPPEDVLAGTKILGTEIWRYTLQIGVLVNIVLAVFNLMPIPPLDGSRLVGWLLPEPLQPAWYGLDRIGLFLLIGFLYLGGLDLLAVPMSFALYHITHTIDGLSGLGGFA